MMKNIYDLLNDVQTNVQDYTIEEVSELEKKRMKQMVRRCAGKKRSYKKLAGAACAVVLVTAFTFSAPGNMVVYAAGEGIAWHISNFMGLDRDLQDYATVVGTSQTDQGYTIRLNEVILDQSSLVVSTNVYKEGANTEEELQELQMGIPMGRVFVNGRLILDGASGGARLEDDNSVGSVIRYDLGGIDTSGELDIKLVFDNISLREGSPTGKWKFHFVADGSALAADTTTIPVNYQFALENGAKVSLTDYKANALGQRFYFTIDGVPKRERADYNLRLSGIDDLGQEVIFETMRINGNEGTGYMECQIIGAPVTEQTKWLKLTPYAVGMPKESGRMNNDYQPVGEAFTIDLVNGQRQA